MSASPIETFREQLATLQRFLTPVLALSLLAFPPRLHAGKGDANDGFLPIADLLKRPLPKAIAISPNGRYIAGQRFEKFGQTYRQAIFCFDLEEKKAWGIGNGKYDNWITDLFFLNDEELLVRFPMSDSWEKFDISGANQKIILPSVKNVSHPLYFLRNGKLLNSYIRTDPGTIIVDLDDFSNYTGQRNNRFLKEGEMPRGLYKIDTDTLEWELLASNAGEILYYECDENYQPRLAYKLPGIEYDRFGDLANEDWLRENCSPEVWLWEDGAESRKLDFSIRYQERSGLTSFSSPSINSARNTLCFASDAFDKAVALKEMDLASGAISTVSKREDLSVGGVLRDAWSNEIVGVVYHDGLPQVEYFDEELASIYQSLKKTLPDWRVELHDWDTMRMRFIVRVWNSRSHGIYFLYDRVKKTLEEIYTEAPWMDEFADALGNMNPISYKSRDGLSIHGYLTLPSDARATAPYPTILFLHGGPWTRDYYRYDPLVQFFANRGYAVAQLNFRGSSGYSRAFLNAGNGEWGKTMQNDISDGVLWAIEQGIADKDRIGIAGFSYGGYASLMGVCSTPELYAVGIPMMAVSDISQQIKHYEDNGWEDAARFWKSYVIPEGGSAENLREVSPVYLVDNIRAPLLVYHGRRDDRVDPSHTNRLVRELRKRKKTYQSVYSIREGHSFKDLDNLEHLLVKIEKFLSKYMPSDLMQSER